MMTGIDKHERDFQELAIKKIRQLGGYVIKEHISAFQSQGEPDIICCYGGRFVAFELKVGNNKTSKLQDFKIQQIKNAGGIAKAVYSLKEIEEVLYEIFRVQQSGEPKQ